MPPELGRVYALTHQCEVCQKSILPGHTWKFTSSGGKVHYYCGKQNPRQNPISLDPRHFLRYGTVMKPARGAKQKPGSAHGALERTRRKLGEAIAGSATVRMQKYKGERIWQEEDGWRVSLDPDSLFDSLKDAKRFVDTQILSRNPLFNKGYGTTFQSGADRSGGALRAESGGLESAIDAARRLKLRPWTKLAMAEDMYEREYSPSESHHVRTRAGVVEVAYRLPEDWDAIAKNLKSLYSEALKWS